MKKLKDSDNICDYSGLGITGKGITAVNVSTRKSSAEIVSEARSMLTGGVRLVSTRRPVTPRDPRRQLYGAKLAPPGRPPSSFSLRYLQFESGRPLPPLEPIYQQTSPPSEQNDTTDENAYIQFRRSGSVGTLLDKDDSSWMINENINLRGSKKKIPSLLSPIKVTDEFGNDCADGEQDLHPLWHRQSRSFDMPLKPSERLIVTDDNKEDNQIEGQTKTPPFNIRNSFDSSERGNLNSSNGGEHTNLLGNNLSSSKTRLLLKSNLLSQSTTETLLELLKANAGIKDCSDETVQHINAILVELYSRVKGPIKCERRGSILGGLYGLVECSSPKILLAVARVVLALSVTGSNLTGACKLVFKVARNELNDFLFFETDVPELLVNGLGRASPLDDPEACIYGYGAVRFLFNASLNQSTSQNNDNNRSGFNNNKNLNNDQINKKQKKSLAIRLSKAGAIQLMILHLQILNEIGAEKPLVGQPLHALYQLSAALRALAGIPQIYLENNEMDYSQEKRNSKTYEQMDEIDNNTDDDNIPTPSKSINLELACPHLVKAAEITLGESEIQTNIVRTLSVLSDHDACCSALAEYVGRIGVLLGPCITNDNYDVPQKPLGLLSRLGYILGNIMARFDSARLQFYHNDVAMEYLLNTLNVQSKQKLSTENQNDDTVVEVLIKLIRVIANMSVNADVGNGIGSKPLLGQVLLRMLMKINQMSSDELTDDIEELLQAILGAMHNLCFYQDQPEKENSDEKLHADDNNELTSMNELIPELSIALCNTLKSSSSQIKAEVSRVLGNMTRNAVARDAFCTAGGLREIIQCLKSDDYELKSTCSGVLVNLLGDWERRMPFYEMCGPLILNEILEKSAKQSDWLLASIVCQAFWNYLIDSCDVVNTLGEDETDKISSHLVEYLDEEKLFKGESPDLIWEQFASVATDLLERIQSSLEQGNDSLADIDI